MRSNMELYEINDEINDDIEENSINSATATQVIEEATQVVEESTQVIEESTQEQAAEEAVALKGKEYYSSFRFPSKNLANYNEFYVKCAQYGDSLGYLKSRGISSQTTEMLGFGYHYGSDGFSLIQPLSDSSFIQRTLDGKQFKKFGSASLHNAAILKKEGIKNVFLVEGGIDLASFIEIGIDAISVISAGGVKKAAAELISLAESNPQIKEITYHICLDQDNAGNNAAQTLQAELFTAGFKTVNSSLYADLGVNDANEAIVTDKNAFVEGVAKAILGGLYGKEYVDYKIRHSAASIACHLDFSKDSEATKVFLNTGFEALNGILGGGLPCQSLTMVSGMSSLGKTTFCDQLVENMVKLNSNLDILLCSLEMTKLDMILKSISRSTFVNNKKQMDNIYSKTSSQLAMNKSEWSEEEVNYVSKCRDHYLTHSENIFLLDCTDSHTIEGIELYVRNHVQMRGKPCILVVDYLQLVKSEKSQGSDKQEIDATLLVLRKLTVELGVTILLIASLNRASYSGSQKTLGAISGSANTEYSADVLISLTSRSTQTKDPVTFKMREMTEDELRAQAIRRVDVNILKYRNGQTGKIPFNFFAPYSYFEETVEALPQAEENFVPSPYIGGISPTT